MLDQVTAKYGINRWPSLALYDTCMEQRSVISTVTSGNAQSRDKNCVWTHWEFNSFSKTWLVAKNSSTPQPFAGPFGNKIGPSIEFR